MLNVLQRIIDAAGIVAFGYGMFFVFFKFHEWLISKGFGKAAAIILSALLVILIIHGANVDLAQFQSP